MQINTLETHSQTDITTSSEKNTYLLNYEIIEGFMEKNLSELID